MSHGHFVLLSRVLC
uniref:Uncharacterized protein n=1 Tax=Arundo donax TaxID=35708 RepID=A0A0A9B4C2_ARUDO